MTFPRWLISPFLLVGILVTGCSTSENTQIAKLQKEVEKLREDSDAIKIGVSQQSEVLHRAVGEVIPVRLSEPTKATLRELDAVFKSPDKWPKSGEQAEELRGKLARLVKEIPPWAEEEHLPGIAMMRWGAEAFWLICKQGGDNGETAEALEAALRNLLEREPEQTPDALKKWVKERADNAKDVGAKHRLKQAIAKAEEAIQGKGDPATALSALEEFSDKDEVRRIQPNLRLRIVETNAADRLKVLTKTLASSLKCTSERLRQGGIARVQDAATNLLFDLEVADPRPGDSIQQVDELIKQCDKELIRIAAQQQEDASKRIRAYQAWALGQIKKFDGPQGWYYDVMGPSSETAPVLSGKSAPLEALELVYRAQRARWRSSARRANAE